MPSAGGRGALARPEHVAAPDDPPVQGEAPGGWDAQRLTLGPEGRRLDEDAEVALAACRAVDQGFDPIAGAVGCDDHHAAATTPAVAVSADRIGKAADAVIGGQREKVEQTEPLQ